MHWVSNAIVVLLIAGAIGAARHASRDRFWRENAVQLWRRRRVAISVIAVYLLIALLDSISWIDPASEANALTSGRARTIIDRIFQPERFKEVSYSAPLASVAFYGGQPLLHPSTHLLGTDLLGRDVVYRTLKGARVALLIGGLTSLVVIPIALLFGVSAGYFGHRIDDAVFFAMTVLASVPPLLLLIALIMALGKFVVGRAVDDASRWPQAIGVAVNVTGDEFRDPHFTEHVRTALEIHGFDPSRLTIEITESIFTVDIAIVRKGLAELRDIGVLVAIDDFGVGFSSINHLKEFPVDRLKIDRSFTQDVMSGGRETELVDIILRLGRIFNVRTTIEGIENEDQLELVRALGVGDVQGFLISRPVPANTVIAMVARPGNDDLSGPLRISA